MTRRDFLRLLAALPGLAWIRPAEAEPLALDGWKVQRIHPDFVEIVNPTRTGGYIIPDATISVKYTPSAYLDGVCNPQFHYINVGEEKDNQVE